MGRAFGVGTISPCCHEVSTSGKPIDLWEFSKVLSRNGALERFGPPVVCNWVKHGSGIGKTWSAWCESLPGVIQSIKRIWKDQGMWFKWKEN